MSKNYIVDGEPFEVAPHLEEQFLADMKSQGKTPRLSQEEEEGKTTDDATDANATSTTAASNQEEVVQPQNNQTTNTESPSEDTSSGSQEDKKPPGFFEELYTSGQQGLVRGEAVDEAFNIYKQGASISDEDLQSYIDAANKINSMPPTKAQEEFETLQKGYGGGVFGTLKALKNRPEFFPQMIVSSAATMLGAGVDSDEVQGSIALGAGAGAATGAAAGLVGGPLAPASSSAGAIAGTATGAMMGLIGASETALTLTDLLNEELGDKDFNKENIRSILEDQDAIDRITSASLARGLTIAAVEGLTMGLSRGLGSTLVKSGKSAFRVGATTTATEMTGAFAGEVAGQAAAGQDIDLGEATLESLGEVGSVTGPVTSADKIYQAVKNGPSKYKVNGEKVSRGEVERLVKNPNTKVEELAKIDIEIENDANLKNFVEAKKKDAFNETQVDAKVSDVADRKKLVELEKKRVKAKMDMDKTGIFAVPGAKENLENVEAEILGVIEKYSSVDGRTKDVRARKKEAKTVRDATLEKTIKFAEEQGKVIGKETIVADNNKDAQEIFNRAREEYNAKDPKDQIAEADVSNSDGFIVGDTIVINKDIAGRTGQINVGAHELLHGVVAKHMKGLSDGDRTKLITDFKNTLTSKQFDYIKNKIEARGDLDIDSTEEWLNIMSDGITKGEISFNEGVFDKIKNFIQEIARKVGIRKEFQNGRQVYNFMKDYQASIKKNKLSTRAVKLAEEGAPVTETKFSVEASEKVQSIYDEQGEAGAFDIIDQFKPIVNKIVEKRREAPNFDKQLLTDEIETGKRGIFDLIREYKPESGVPLAAYINKFLPARAIEASKRVLGEEFTDDVTEAKGVTATDTAEDTMTQEAKPKRKGIVLADRLKVREQVAPLAEQYVKDNDLTGTTYKKTPNIATETVGKLMSIPSKKITSNANLSKPELANAQMFIAKNADMLQSMLPEGATEDGTATGVQKVLLDQFYNKKSKRAKTKAGLATQAKRPDITRSQFLEVFGIVDGKPQRDDRNTSSRVLALAKQLDRAMSNQSIREVLSKDDNSIAVAQKLADGKSKVMFSKSANLDNWLKLVDEISNTDLNEESIINAVDNTYPELKDRNKKPIINQILKDVQEFKDIDASLKGNFTEIVDKEVKDFLLEQFENRQYSQGIKAMLKSVLPKKENGSPVDPGNRAKDINGVQKQRSHLVNQGSKIIDTFGVKKGLEIIISHLGPVYASASKIGDGSITVETPGSKVVLNKDFKGPSQNRQQVTTGMPDFIALLNTIPGVEVESIQGKRGYQAIVDGKTVKLETTLLAEKSEAFLKDRDFNRRKEQAEEARKVVKTMLDNAWSRYKDSKDSFDAADFGLLAMSLGSSMEAPLRRAANAEFIQDGIEAVIARGKKAGIPLKKIVRYEHMKSKEAVISEIIDSYMNTGELDPSVFDGYQVQVISGTLDGLIDKAGYKTKSPQDGSPRAYNEKTLFEAVKIYKDFKDELGPIRSLDPEKAGTDQEYIGKVWNKALEMVTGGKDADAKELESLGRARRTYKWSKDIPEKGMSAFDFDETLIIGGENFVVATNPITGEQVKIKSEEWPIDGPVLAEEGYEFDFSDFANVRGGKEGPLLQKMKNQIKKYGNKNVFVLTARQQASAEPIHEWLKSQGINIPLENITGLGKSEGEAKGQWMLEKFNEGYNDMYFVDDALPNVKAVKDVLDQLDVKSKVVQAKVKFSKDGAAEFNKMLERNTGVNRDKIFSDALAKRKGAKANRIRFFVPPSAEDFKGLIYNFLGRGRQGDSDMQFFKEHLLDPFTKGVRDINFAKQRISEEFKTLRKEMPDVVKSFKNKVTGTDFTVNDAIRVYLWNKNEIAIPGLSEQETNLLSDHVSNDPKVKAFADTLGVISRANKGYVTPGENWVAGSIASDLYDQSGKINRAEYLSEWIENKNNVFSPDNINKIEAVYGTDFRDALENILGRMETGSNRVTGSSDKTVNRFMDWINGSVGAVMFFNTRSAALQTLSTVNFIDWSDNNIFKASKAFANQPQYWKDFMTLFNSDMLKQRRAGMEIDVNLAELSNAVAKSSMAGKAKAALRYLLQIGFTPTQIADSFAIASGGSTFYRNKINKYVKQGLSQKEAETRAFEDFQEIAEETQQSSRPDLISQQQAGTLGRLILAWQNTPMQYTRLTKKAISDLANRRGDWKSHVSRILYYGAMQNIIFGSLQTGLAFLMFGNDEDEEKTNTKLTRVANGALDTLLRGTGVYGAMASTLKNTIMKYAEESEKSFGRKELSKVGIEAVQLSPPIGSKIRKIMKAIYSYEYNKGVPEKMGLDIDNPALDVVGNLVEATTNVPMARTVRKAQQVEEAINGNHEMWKRVALIMGWDKWSLDVKDADVDKAKAEVKQERADKKKAEKKAKKEETKKKEEQGKKDKGVKEVRCSATKSNGQRCKIMVETKGKTAKCAYHKSYKKGEGSDTDGDGIKEYQCTAVTKSGRPCKNRTEHRSKKCYAHQ